jgi:tetratricopeptide (TPR) repeat protein
MGREIVYCSQCGVRILEKDLAAGRAFTVLDKVFCAECRDQAFTQGPGPARPDPPLDSARGKPQARPVKEAPTATRPLAGIRNPAAPLDPARGKPPRRPEGVASPRVTVKRSNPMPLYIGSAVGVIGIVILIVIVMSSKSGNAKTGPGGGPGAASGGPPQIQNMTPEARAAHRLNELHQFASTATDPAAVVKRAAEVEKDIVGTPSEEGYRTLRKRWERKIAEVESGKKIDALLAQAKSIAGGDPEFKRFAEVRDLLQKADELGLDAGPEKVADVQNFRKSLEEPYEAAGEAWFEKYGPSIKQWMKELDFKAALKIIDRYPEALKLAKAWRIYLTKLREDAEKGKAAEEAKAAGKEVAKEWTYYHNIGNQERGLKNYARAKENLLKAESLLPAPDKLTDRQKEAVAWNILYNLGCLFAIESKDKKGDDQKKAVDTAFDYLRKSAERASWGTVRAQRRLTAKDHWERTRISPRSKRRPLRGDHQKYAK